MAVGIIPVKCTICGEEYRISLISPFPEEDQTTKIKHILDNFECPQCKYPTGN